MEKTCEEKSGYNRLNEFYKSKFGERVLKISVDGGFTCPNRDGKCGVGGCVFCNGDGSGKHRNGETVTEQIKKHLSSYRGERAKKFIAYFQSFSNTYSDVSTLRSKYDEALASSGEIIGLSVATRPDCITEEIADLLSSYTPEYYVQVELGLQTSSDETAKKINRGYKSEVFSAAVEILAKRNIDVVAHVMVGLPDETQKDLENTVDFLNAHEISGVKIHSTYVLKNTALEKSFERGEYIPLEMNDYIEAVVFVLTHLRPDIIVHRISGDAPKDELVAPEWNVHKKPVLNGVDKIFREKKLFQGIYYNAKPKN